MLPKITLLRRNPIDQPLKILMPVIPMRVIASIDLDDTTKALRASPAMPYSIIEPPILFRRGARVCSKDFGDRLLYRNLDTVLVERAGMAATPN